MQMDIHGYGVNDIQQVKLVILQSIILHLQIHHQEHHRK